jgi:RNA polymerase sigma-70 factor (ECF subfamily)
MTAPVRDASEVVNQLGAARGPLSEACVLELRTRLEPLATRFDTIDAAQLAQALLQRLPSRENFEDELLRLRLDDLVLALACLARDASALDELDVVLRQTIKRLGRRLGEGEREELEQLVRIRLLVGAGGAPGKLALYSGRGALGGFVRVVALNLLSQRQASGQSDTALAALPDPSNWESRVLRVDQQLHFRDAFRRAVQTLTARQRALLRLNLLDGLSIDELSPLYGAHRSSVARWLAEARAALDAQTRKLLGELLKLSSEEIERLLSSTQSGFELSLSRALRESMPPPDP